MEIIKKQISIDACRSHKPGLLPFVHSINGGIINDTSSENHNYGHFVCDLSGTTGVFKYLDIIRRYNEIKEILRTAIYCKCKNNVLKICEKPIIDNCVGSCDCGETLYDYEPRNINDFYQKGANFFIPVTTNIVNESCYILFDNFDIYEKHEKWGKDNGLATEDNFFSFFKYVDEKIIKTKDVLNDGFNLLSPTVDISILLENEYTVDTLYYPYEYSLKDDRIISIYDMDNSDITIFSDTVIDDNIEVESKLEKLIHPESINIADGFTGIMKDWTESGGTLCKCKYNGISWEIESGVTDNNIICADREEIESGTKKYRNITILSCIPYYVPNPQSGDVYYFIVRFKNDKDNLLSFPFIKGEPVNIETYDNETIFDKIISISEPNEDGLCDIEYAIGVISGETGDKGGIFYKEKLRYESGVTQTWIDGVMEADLYYEKLDYDSNAKLVYNKDYGVTTFIKPAFITKMEVGKIFNENIKVPLITKEGTENLYSNPQIMIDMDFNRGNAAGWEKHFKLSECNTMRDLENYGNNVFNL